MASVRSCPPEIVASILSYIVVQEYSLDFPYTIGLPLAPYATICRQWQSTVESYTFKTIILTASRLEQANTILLPRLQHLRAIHLLILLPTNDPFTLLEYEFPTASVCSDLFTSTVTDFFNTFHELSYESNRVDHSFKLRLTCKIPNYDPHTKRGQPHNADGQDLIYVSLPAMDTLPDLPGATHFSTYLEADPVQFEPAAICRLAFHMPRLQSFRLSLFDTSTSHVSQTTKFKNDLGRSLPSLPQSIQDFALTYSQPTCSPISKAAEDNLSSALCDIASRPNMVEFFTEGTFETCIIGAPPYQLDAFSNLRELVIWISPDTPLGNHLLLDEPPGFLLDSDSESDAQSNVEEEHPVIPSTASYVNTATLEPALLRAAGIVGQMPKLLRFSFLIQGLYLFKLAYKHGFLAIHSHHAYEPNPEILQAWLQATRAHKGSTSRLDVMMTSSGPRQRNFALE